MKKTLSLITAGLLSVLLLAGCGAATNSSTDTSKATDTSKTSEASTTSGETKKVVIGATSTPHAEILETIVEPLKAKGIELDIKVFGDYQVINAALTDKEVDLNYFQHTPFLDSYNTEKNGTLVSIGKIHYEPFGIYAGKTKALADLKEGAKVGIPNDTSNGARALLLLEQEGLIKLKEGAGLAATKLDIVENTKKLDIVEIAAEQLPRSLPDLDIATLNGNYALDAGFKVNQALAVEASDSVAAETFGNIIAARAEDKDNETFKAVVDALKTAEVKKFIDEKYEGGVVAIF